VTLYRIYTERKNLPEIERILTQAGFDGFTILDAVGFWKGKAEYSVVVEILTEDDAQDFHVRVHKVAKTIKRVNAQDAVLITSSKVDSLLV